VQVYRDDTFVLSDGVSISMRGLVQKGSNEDCLSGFLGRQISL